MKVAFHTNQLNLRGTSVALFDYAHFNKMLLGNESIIVYEKNNSMNELVAIEYFKNNFNVYSYGQFSEVDKVMSNLGIDVCYYIKSGEKDGKINTVGKCVIHNVFQVYEPHGHVYAYISDWLSKKMTKGESPVVPHIVQLPEPESNIRVELGIPNEAIVFGRHGG